MRRCSGFILADSLPISSFRTHQTERPHLLLGVRLGGRRLGQFTLGLDAIAFHFLDPSCDDRRVRTGFESDAVLG